MVVIKLLFVCFRRVVARLDDAASRGRRDLRVVGATEHKTFTAQLLDCISASLGLSYIHCYLSSTPQSICSLPPPARAATALGLVVVEGTSRKECYKESSNARMSDPVTGKSREPAWK
jgi:hypothetical protein